MPKWMEAAHKTSTPHKGLQAPKGSWEQEKQPSPGKSSPTSYPLPSGQAPKQTYKFTRCFPLSVHSEWTIGWTIPGMEVKKKNSDKCRVSHVGGYALWLKRMFFWAWAMVEHASSYRSHIYATRNKRRKRTNLKVSWERLARCWPMALRLQGTTPIPPLARSYTEEDLHLSIHLPTEKSHLETCFSPESKQLNVYTPTFRLKIPWTSAWLSRIFVSVYIWNKIKIFMEERNLLL